MDAIPVWALFAIVIAAVVMAIEAGYRLGRFAHRRSEEEKESPTSAFAGAVLGLVAFLLAFTFSIVTNRYDARKGFVRDDANAIRTAYSRADFLPDPDRGEAKALLKEYLDARLAFVQSRKVEAQPTSALLAESKRVHSRLWDMAVANARKDMDSDVAALYIESLNDVAAIHALRIAVGAQERIPLGIWCVLAGLTVLGMMSMGYHAGIAGSNRSMSMLILALAFAMVIAMIASLDRPDGFIRVTQQPLLDLQRALTGGA